MEKKTCNVNVRVTEEQHAELERMAEQFSLRKHLDSVSVSSMIRSMILARGGGQGKQRKTSLVTSA